MNPLRRVFGQSSWTLASDRVRACVTQLGGHLGPVTFKLGRREVQPFSVPPWHDRPPPGIPPVLAVLRGDFFCFPFGGNARPFRGERHPPHGETANRRWRFVSGTADTLHLRMTTRARPARVDKHVFLVPGQTAVYQRHVIRGASGPMPLGHHAMLHFPGGEGSGLIATSPFAWGQVLPGVFETPANRGYSSLRPGAKFGSLARVPLAAGGTTDLSRYPARRGFEDLAMLVGRKTAAPFAWTAVSRPAERYVWFALKDPRILTNTLLWHSNGGRHYPPWDGRHVDVLGLEEVTSYFHHGVAESAAPNGITAAGGRTCLALDPRTPLVVNYLMALARVPADFDHVASIEPDGEHGVRLQSRGGAAVRAAVDWRFLASADAPPRTPVRS